jgi:hypothetical protein
LIFEDFSKICHENSRFIKNLARITDTLNEKPTKIHDISMDDLIMRNVSEEVVEKIKKHILYSIFPPKIVPFMR